jgi:hypothetical protein
MRLARILERPGLPLPLENLLHARNGKPDGNGCPFVAGLGLCYRHRASKPNRNVKAPVKKSREHLRHGEASSNYGALRYLVPYPLKAAGRSSGARPSR